MESERNLWSKRGFGGLRLGLAQEFCQHAGSAKSFRTLFDPAKDESFQRLYSALDIRKARLRMAGEPDDATRPAVLPPMINVRMSKGGTGKSTACSNIATCLSLMGYRVLMIDADPQASLTSIFGINWSKEKITHIGHLMHAVYQGRVRSGVGPCGLFTPVACWTSFRLTSRWPMLIHRG